MSQYYNYYYRNLHLGLFAQVQQQAVKLIKKDLVIIIKTDLSQKTIVDWESIGPKLLSILTIIFGR